MSDQRISIVNFGGGLSDDDKFGPPNSWGWGDRVDFRRSLGMLSMQRLLQKESSTIVNQEIVDAVRDNTGTVWMLGCGSLTTGSIFKRAPGANGAAGTYTSFATYTQASVPRDMDYQPFFDTIFVFGGYNIGTIKPLSGSPAYTSNTYGPYTVTTNSAGGGFYPLPTAISEVDVLSFVASNDPLTTFSFFKFDTGTGDWTITIHDALNNVIATQTIPAASIAPGHNFINFTPAAAGTRFKIGQTYHIHLTVSTGTSTVVTLPSNLLADATYVIYGGRLIQTDEIGHRLMKYGPKILFCNEHYLGEWEILSIDPGVVNYSTAGYNPNLLEFPPEVKTIGIAPYSEYVAIAGRVDDYTDSATKQNSKGIIFFYDGVSSNYTFSLDIPAGSPESLFSDGVALYWIASGKKQRWAGGDIETIFEFPVVATEGPPLRTNLTASRQAIAKHENLITSGFPYNRTSTTISPYMGLYSHGQSKASMPVAAGYDNVISTGNQLTTLTGGVSSGITLLKKFGNNLLVAWRDYVSSVLTYGVDYINELSPSVASASWAGLWFDGAHPDQEKSAKAIKITFDPLPAGCTVTPTIEFDRSGSPLTEPVAVAGDREVVMTLPSTRFYEARFGMTMTSSSGRYPHIRSITFKYDDNRNDENNTEVMRV